MFKNSKILLIAAHPDDEVLGCGASIPKFVKDGCDVDLLIISEGETARDEKFNLTKRINEIKKREENAIKSSKLLGINNIKFYRLPDNRLDQYHIIDVTKIIEKYISKNRPEIIFTHCGSDLNVDHRIVFQSTLTACRPMKGLSVKKILSWENMSSTEWSSNKIGNQFSPNIYVDVSKTISLKKEALSFYKDEMRPFPHPRSWEAIEALAKFRGSNSGKLFAEAFELVRYCD